MGIEEWFLLRPGSNWPTPLELYSFNTTFLTILTSQHDIGEWENTFTGPRAMYGTYSAVHTPSTTLFCLVVLTPPNAKSHFDLTWIWHGINFQKYGMFNCLHRPSATVNVAIRKIDCSCWINKQNWKWPPLLLTIYTQFYMHRGGNQVFALYAQKKLPVGGYGSLTGMMRKTYSAERQQKKRNTKEQHLIMQISKGAWKGVKREGNRWWTESQLSLAFLCLSVYV